MDNEKFDQWAEERRHRRAERDARRAGRRDEARDPEGPARKRRGGAGDRKERVLHTRISDQLDDSLKRAADEMRVPVSNLVRNVLEDVFTVVETVTENVGDLVSDLMDESDGVRDRLGRRRRRWAERDVSPDPPDDKARRAAEREVNELLEEDRDHPEFEHVLGWQPFVLNAAQQCADCGRDLIRGDRAFLGHATQGEAPYLCTECLGARG
ncbi:MAG: hypothetical protein JRG76_04975 [Deltaproteobacteria bacterium]|nr:hypothetical protein [Deltaproteobacteria bacterium]MBW2413844.1 hypothetical protein [Deltaproteobacteria bacterium]